MFNRFELKYLITLKQAEAFKSDLKAYLVADEHGNEDGSYGIANLYYDSPDYRCYWEKMDGVKFRRKLRIRQYQNGKPITKDTPVFVEIKQRYDHVTQKRRAILPYGDALQVCNGRLMLEHEQADQAVLEEVVEFLWQYNLRTASIVQYRRQAFISAEHDIGLRVTFDTLLSCQTQQQNLHEGKLLTPMLPVDWSVMEIKVNERIPYWLTDMVARHNLTLHRFSKYCRSIKTQESRWYAMVPAANPINLQEY